MKRTAAALMILALITVAPGCSNVVLNRKIRRNAYQLRGVYAANQKHVWAVGERGKVLFFDGSRWGTQDSATEENLWSISGIDENHIWAVGDEGTITFYDGSRWTRQESRVGKNLRAVTAIAGDNAWAVGQKTILHYEGSTWSEQPTDWDLTGVTASDADHVWAVGQSGVLFNNAGWKLQYRSRMPLLGVSAVDQNHVWAVGVTSRANPVATSTVLRFDGAWHEDLQVPDAQLQAVDALDKDNVWAVGVGGNAHFDGSSWERFNLVAAGYPFSVSLNGVNAVNPGSVWAVGTEIGARVTSVPTIRAYDGSHWNTYNPRW